jgi:hypothetical protein
MSEFNATATEVCNKITARGVSETYDHPITIADMKKFARANGVNNFHAYCNGSELNEDDFPVSGTLEIREYSAPKQ